MNSDHLKIDQQTPGITTLAEGSRSRLSRSESAAVGASRRSTWVIMAMTLALAVTADADTTLERLAGWPYAGARAVAVDSERDLLYLGSGGVILVLDVSDPADPTLLYDGMYTGGHVRDLWFASDDRRLYVGDWRGGLEIWDVNDPVSPTRLSSTLVYYYGTDFDQPTDSLFLDGDILYINANEARVHAFNVSDPANPIDLDVQAGPNWYDLYDRDTDDVAVANGYVYVAGDGIAKFRQLSDGTLSKVGEYLNISSVPCIEVRGSFAYTSLNQSFGVFHIAGSEPAMVASADLPETLNDLAIKDDLVIGVGVSGLYIFDVSVPQQPQQIAFLSQPVGYRVRLDGDIAYVPSDDDGVLVIDISDPYEPVEIGRYDTVGSTRHVRVADSLAFLGQDTQGLVIADISSPAAVQVAGDFDGSAANESVRIGDYLYLTDWDVRALRVLDVSDASNPVEVGGVYDFYAVYIETDGEYLYVVRFDVDAQLDYLHVFGLTDPTAPEELGTMLIGPYIFKIAIGNGHLFALEFYDQGVHIIDLSDPYNPHEDAFYPVFWPQGIWIEGDRAYVTSTLDGLLVLDIQNPASPEFLGGYGEPFELQAVAVSGDLAFITTGSTGVHRLRLYDVGDPGDIRELDRILLPGDAWRLTVAGNCAFIADGITGLQIVCASTGILGDLNNDGCVDQADLGILLAAYNANGSGDLDADGDTDQADLGALLGNYGQGC
jgi:hypothetical protein